MPAGLIAVNTIPGWPSPPDGLLPACEAALAAGGFRSCTMRPDGLWCPDTATVQNVLNTFVGGASQLTFVKAQKQAALDVAFDSNFDLAKFIRGGTATNVTGANVSAFLATVTNNYRTLRASIASAANVAAVNAININSGWPANP